MDSAVSIRASNRVDMGVDRQAARVCIISNGEVVRASASGSTVATAVRMGWVAITPSANVVTIATITEFFIIPPSFQSGSTLRDTV